MRRLCLLVRLGIAAAAEQRPLQRLKTLIPSQREAVNNKRRSLLSMKAYLALLLSF